MHVLDIWLSQRNLKRAEQIPALVEAILSGEVLPKILLSFDEDGSIQLEDGHHRLMAYWLAGRERLEPYEYLLIPTERKRPRFGKIVDLERAICPKD